MASSRYIICLLCVLGFFKEFRPSEPYLSPFLNGPKNFTETEINNDIYPVGTYSSMSLLILVFLLTDWLKYKPIIVLQGLSGIVTWSLLLWTDGIPLMQLAQVCYGLFSASDVAYTSYLYAKVEKKQYQKATAQTKATLLVAKAGSGLVAQLLVMYHVLNYEELNYITLAVMCLVTVWACILPPVEESYYFNRTKQARLVDENTSPLRVVVTTEETDSQLPAAAPDKSYNLKDIFYVWKTAMKNPVTLKWSLWSALTICGYLQATYYIQLLWQAMINAEKNVKLYHGFSNSFNSLAGSLCTYAVGYIHVDWGRYGTPAMAVASIVEGGLILIISFLHGDLFFHYLLYATFKIIHQVASTIVSSEIARSLESESFGLVFGVNQFFALVAQSILTLLVTKLFPLPIRQQYFLYGAYFVALGVGFAIFGGISYCLSSRRRKS